MHPTPIVAQDEGSSLHKRNSTGEESTPATKAAGKKEDGTDNGQEDQLPK